MQVSNATYLDKLAELRERKIISEEFLQELYKIVKRKRFDPKNYMELMAEAKVKDLIHNAVLKGKFEHDKYRDMVKSFKKQYGTPR